MVFSLVRGGTLHLEHVKCTKLNFFVKKCVYNQWAYAVDCVDAVDWLLIFQYNVPNGFS